MTDEDKSILEDQMKRWGSDNISEFLRCLIQADDSDYAPTRTKLALSIAFPSHTVAKKDEGELLVPLQRTARTLSQRMGCPVYPYGSAR